MTNEDIARRFNQMASLMEVRGEDPFRLRSYLWSMSTWLHCSLNGYGSDPLEGIFIKGDSHTAIHHFDTLSQLLYREIWGAVLTRIEK